MEPAEAFFLLAALQSRLGQLKAEDVAAYDNGEAKGAVQTGQGPPSATLGAAGSKARPCPLPGKILTFVLALDFGGSGVRV